MERTLHREEEGSGRTEELTVDVDGDATVTEMLQAAGIDPQTVIVERDGAVVPLADTVADATTFRVLDVISGG